MNKLNILNFYLSVSSEFLCVLLRSFVLKFLTQRQAVSLNSASLIPEIHYPLSTAIYIECTLIKIKRVILAFRCFAGYFLSLLCFNQDICPVSQVKKIK